MNRILIDLPDTQVAKLATLVQTQRRARAAVIRDAIDAYLAQHAPRAETRVFGLWKERKTDGLDYQQALRAEW